MEEFQVLLPRFTARFEAYVATHTLDGEPRQGRAYSTYTNSPLPTMEDKLFFILVYLKTANLQVVQGALFGMSQPVANKWIHRLLPIVNQALAELDELPLCLRSGQAARTVAELELNPDEEGLYFHDGTERPINRPTDAAAQTTYYYSGKPVLADRPGKKQHTVKAILAGPGNNVIINGRCKIIFLTDTVEGKKHDKKLADEAGYTLPPGSVLVQDTGFQGFALDGVVILKPHRSRDRIGR